MIPATIPLETMLRRLHLANAPRIYRELCDQAERESWSYHDFLATLVAEEIAHRQQTRLQRLARKARFPFLKTIEEFNFTFQSTVRQSLLGSYLTLDFVTEGRCLVLFGKTGRGKTHLAIAIAYRAIQNGFDALFCTAAALIDDLSDAAASGRLREALHTYTSPDVLVIDEVGYLAYGANAANVLFHVVNERHQKRKAMLLTTNKPTESWGAVLHDHDLADVIVDRILERGRVLKLDGPSYRTRHLGLDEQPQAGVSTKPDRISGTHRQGTFSTAVSSCSPPESVNTTVAPCVSESSSRYGKGSTQIRSGCPWATHFRHAGIDSRLSRPGLARRMADGG